MLPAEQLDQIETRYEEVIRLLGDPEVIGDPDRLRELGMEQSELEPIVQGWRSYRELKGALAETRSLQDGDPGDDMRELIDAELRELEERIESLEARLTELLLPKDPDDRRNAIIEIRAGTGGDEASLFAAELYRMYVRHAEALNFKCELIDSSPTGIGGMKEVVFQIRGQGAYGKFKWEGGVHRVQRVPETESSGRIHTSTATVAVLPEMDAVEVDVPESDLRIDVFRSSGPGGQSVNTTDSAVRITHVPTGIVVSCQDEKSQHQNRRKALQVLRARLHQLEKNRQLAELGQSRSSQIGTGERSEKIRTYNFPQNRVTDHRVNRSSHRLQEVLAGEISEFTEALEAADRDRKLEEVHAG